MEVNSLKFSSLKRKEFRKVLKKGRRKRFLFLTLIWLKNEEKKVRIGILISTKFSKKATLRNKVKRRIREIVRGSIKKIKEGVDLIFIPQKGLRIDYKSLKEKIEKILKETKIVK